LTKSARALRATSVTIDGEAVCCDASGLTIFEELHGRQHNDQAFLCAFDLLDLDGEDYRPQPLHVRKARLERLLAKAAPGVQYSEHVEGDGHVVFEHACKLGLEGIVSKHREHPYRSGRSKTWLKIKNPAASGMLRFERGWLNKGRGVLAALLAKGARVPTTATVCFRCQPENICSV
jgi:bifunctional non-homologous end joining protein LigD